MRVCFLVPDRSRSGGIDTIEGHALRLAGEHGDTAEVVPIDDFDRAREHEWDVALATWWTTIPMLSEVPAARRGVFAQGFDPLHYRGEDIVDGLAAACAVAAPFDVIGVGGGVGDRGRARRPSARCWGVHPGIDRGCFGGPPRRAAGGPLRVLVEGQPSVWFKGVADGLGAARAMRRAPHV